jgi:hypothetical protein
VPASCPEDSCGRRLAADTRHDRHDERIVSDNTTIRPRLAPTAFGG